MAIDDNRSSRATAKLDVLTLLLSTGGAQEARSPARMLPIRSNSRAPSRYVQFDDMKDLVNNATEDVTSSDVARRSSDENEEHQEENRDAQIHPLLRTHRTTKSEIPSHPLLRPSSPRREPPSDEFGTGTHPLLSSSSKSPAKSPPNSHRRSQSVPLKNVDASKASVTSPVSTINIETSILDALVEKLNSYRSKYGDAHPKVATFYNIVGNQNLRQGHYDVALQSYESALRCLKLVSSSSSSSSLSRDDSTSRSIAKTLGNIGTVCWKMGRLPDSLAALHQAVEMLSKMSGKESPDVANLLFTLGMAYSLNGDFEDAIECFDRMKRIMSVAYGPSSVQVARAVDATGNVFMLKGDPEQAVRYHTDALRAKRNALGSKHVSVLHAQTNLAVAYRSSGMLYEALETLNEVLRVRQIVMYGEADMVMRQSLSADIHYTTRLIDDVQADIHYLEGNSNMETIAEDEEF